MADKSCDPAAWRRSARVRPPRPKTTWPRSTAPSPFSWVLSDLYDAISRFVAVAFKQPRSHTRECSDESRRPQLDCHSHGDARQGHSRRRRIRRHHQEAVRRHRRRLRPRNPAATIARCCSAPPKRCSDYISGVILYDETIWQDAKDGTPLVKLIEQAGAIPGIKVDEGTQALPHCPGRHHHRRARPARRAAAEILQAGRAVCEMARGDRYRRRHSELSPRSAPMRMRWRATRRCARRRRSCRSSSRKC